MAYPRDVVWYIEARKWGDPKREPQMGSAVAVAISSNTGEIRKYLLTAAHTLHDGDALDEVLCWRPGHGYVSPKTQPERASGTSFGAMAASPAAIVPPQGSPADRHANADWVLLDVLDEEFQAFPTVIEWGTTPANPITIAGYPGGALTWTKNEPVVCRVVEGFRLVSDAPSAPGMLLLTGPEQAAPGMSGGGVFDIGGNLIGLHRGHRPNVLSHDAIAATHIQDELHARGWSVVSRAPRPDPENTPNRALSLFIGEARLDTQHRVASGPVTVRVEVGVEGVPDTKPRVEARLDDEVATSTFRRRINDHDGDRWIYEIQFELARGELQVELIEEDGTVSGSDAVRFISRNGSLMAALVLFAVITFVCIVLFLVFRRIPKSDWEAGATVVAGMIGALGTFFFGLRDGSNRTRAPSLRHFVQRPRWALLLAVALFPVAFLPRVGCVMLENATGAVVHAGSDNYDIDPGKSVTVPHAGFERLSAEYCISSERAGGIDWIGWFVPLRRIERARERWHVLGDGWTGTADVIAKIAPPTPMGSDGRVALFGCGMEDERRAELRFAEGTLSVEFPWTVKRVGDTRLELRGTLSSTTTTALRLGSGTLSCEAPTPTTSDTPLVLDVVGIDMSSAADLEITWKDGTHSAWASSAKSSMWWCHQDGAARPRIVVHTHRSAQDPATDLLNLVAESDSYQIRFERKWQDVESSDPAVQHCMDFERGERSWTLRKMSLTIPPAAGITADLAVEFKSPATARALLRPDGTALLCAVEGARGELKLNKVDRTTYWLELSNGGLAIKSTRVSTGSGTGTGQSGHVYCVRDGTSYRKCSSGTCPRNCPYSSDLWNESAKKAAGCTRVCRCGTQC